MANVLREWQFLNLTNDTLEIACGGNSFSTGFFDEPDRIEKLAGYCGDFFKRDIKIKIAKQIKNKINKANLPKKNEPGSEINKDSPLPSHVQEVLQIFKGEIKGEVSTDSLETQKRVKEVNARRKKL